MPRYFLGGDLIKEDILGKKIPKKKLKRDVLEENRKAGKEAEDAYVRGAIWEGKKVKRAPKGQDYIETDPLTGKKTHVEVKSKYGKAKLSKLQKATKKKKSNYKVVRPKTGFVL